MIPEKAPVIPLSVPEAARAMFSQNYLKATQNSGRLFLFAGDQKVEHLNKDFYGSGVSPEAADPKHLFEIASKGRIGVFATNLGLIARYGKNYPTIPYMVKLNGKTDLVPTIEADPVSKHWVTIEQVISFKKSSKLDIVGVGLTIYLGSVHESEMLAAASQAIFQAHQHGLLTTVWMYPRGKAVTHERNPDIVAGAAGVAVCLGADFVKVNAPEAADGFASAQLLQQATQAAGNTKVICSGGSKKDEKIFLQDLYHQIHIGGAMGAAVGRNIHQKSTQDAIIFCNAIASVIIDDADVQTAIKCLG